MSENLDAIYENGAFRPVNDADVHLSNGARVRLTVEAITQDDRQNVLELAAMVYDGLSAEDVADVERIAMDRTNFFSR